LAAVRSQPEPACPSDLLHMSLMTTSIPGACHFFAEALNQLSVGAE